MKTKLSIYSYEDYRLYLKDWIEHSDTPRGQLTRISETALIHKTTLSQVLKGDKDLSLEQIHKVSEYMGLQTHEAEYLILLVNFSRAGSSSLKSLFQKQMKRILNERKSLVKRVTRSREMSTEERSIFYSNWIYAAVRNLTSIPKYQDRQSIAKYLHISQKKSNEVIEFLLSTGLCVEGQGKIKVGPQMTHIEATSPLVSRHHGNWRVKAMDKHPVLRDDELAYTAAMTLSAEDAERIRELMSEIVEKTDKIVTDSPSEKLYCMCLDWFEVN
jgi:uncharacterized protein (TIGR02147 family)